MNLGALMITKSDYHKILPIMNKTKGSDLVFADCFNRLREELKEANVVEDHVELPNVVKLYSQFDVETPSGIIRDYHLVLPSDKGLYKKQLSILTPMGSALLGRAIGDTIRWNFPSGEMEITIKKVVHPELKA